MRRNTASLHVALIAVSLRFEGSASCAVARAAGGHVLFGGLVNIRLEVQCRFTVLRKQRIVARLAVTLSAHYVRRVIERHVSVLCHEDELRGRLFVALGE